MKISADISASHLHLAQIHYENFPVASFFLPRFLRTPVALIYSFARQADDFADEGHLSPEQRLSSLQSFRDELNLIQAYIRPNNPFFIALHDVIRQYKLPLQPFYDLLDAFSQDVTQTRYANFSEIMAYCHLSANPIGTLLLHLYGVVNSNNIILSNNICSALQLINFYQDIEIDFNKNEGKNRIYLCQDEMRKYGVTEAHIQNQLVDENWRNFMQFNIHRAKQLLTTGKPLGYVLKGRVGLEMRAIIAGGECIIKKLENCRGDIFKHRPTLNSFDWITIFLKAIFRL